MTFSQLRGLSFFNHDYWNPQRKNVLVKAATAIAVVYLFLPLLIVLPVEGYETRLLWEGIEGFLYTGDLAIRRAFIQQITTFFGNALHVNPWTIWQAIVVVGSPISFLFTYLFVRHFRQISFPHFVLCALAIPSWIVVTQFASDTSLAYPFVTGALYFATRGKFWGLLSGLFVIFAMRARPDAILFLVIIPFVIWVDRKTLRESFIDGALFVLGAVGVAAATLAFYGQTLNHYLISALGQSGMVFPFGWTFDILMKVFTFNSVLVAPFYLIKLFRDAREKKLLSVAWVFIPIIMYVYAYRNVLVTPRYIVYVTPFILIFFYDGARAAIETVRQWRPFKHWLVLPGFIAVLLFNPLFHIASLGGNSESLAERLSRNYEKMIYARLHTGLVPGLNLIYKEIFYSCFRKLDGYIEDFLASPYRGTVLFAFGNDSENTAHHRVLQTYMYHFGIPFSPEMTGKNLPIKHDVTLLDDGRARPGQEINTFTYQGKTFVLIKMRGPLHAMSELPASENWALNQFLALSQQGPDPLKTGDLYKVVSFNLLASYYPKWLTKQGHCEWRPYVFSPPSKAVATPAPAAPTSEAPQPAMSADIARNAPLPKSRIATLIEQPPQPPPIGAEEERLRKLENDRWLQSMPDFEMRLYERLRQTTKKVVTVERGLAGLAILILAVAGAGWLALRRLRREILDKLPPPDSR